MTDRIIGSGCLSGARTHGQSPFNFGLVLLNQGDCPPISRSLSFFNLANASSTPCDQLANSCSFTISSKKSNNSIEIVTFNDFLLRFISPMYNTTLHKILNIVQVVLCTARHCFAGVPRNEVKRNDSGRSDVHDDEHDHLAVSGEEHDLRHTSEAHINTDRGSRGTASDVGANGDVRGQFLHQHRIGRRSLQATSPRDRGIFITSPGRSAGEGRGHTGGDQGPGMGVPLIAEVES